MLDENQYGRLAAGETTHSELYTERHAQVLEMWEQGKCATIRWVCFTLRLGTITILEARALRVRS